jgi:hypothetical protein
MGLPQITFPIGLAGWNGNGSCLAGFHPHDRILGARNEGLASLTSMTTVLMLSDPSLLFPLYPFETQSAHTNPGDFANKKGLSFDSPFGIYD